LNSLWFLNDGIRVSASDIYIVCGKEVTFKINGRFAIANDKKLTKEETEFYVREIYKLANRKFVELDDDFSVNIDNLGIFRVNAYSQSGTYALAIRIVPHFIPDYKKMNIPDFVVELYKEKNGIILFTGTTGSGKSTSMACLIDKINTLRDSHIITLESPIEYRHSHKKSIISQREIEKDTLDYATGLRAAMRQSPDVILIGEMRDYETISAAISAAETGHLVISTLHTMNAVGTIDRIIDVFQDSKQNQIRTQLAETLKVVISQQLVKTKDGKLVPAFEIMVNTNAIKNLIRDKKTHQIDNIIRTSANIGMITMEDSLSKLNARGLI